MRQSQGCMKNKDNTWKEQMKGAREAMSQIIIHQEDERQLDTIRVGVIEWSNWRQGWRKVCGMQTKGSRECRNCQKCTEAHEDVQRSRNQVAEVGFKYFCLDYVSKNGVSVTECNRHHQPLERSTTSPESSLPFISCCNANQVVCMPEVNFVVDSCFSWCVEQIGNEQKWIVSKTAHAGETQSVFLTPQDSLYPLDSLWNLASVVPAGQNDPLFSLGNARGAIWLMVKSKAMSCINAILTVWDGVHPSVTPST